MKKQPLIYIIEDSLFSNSIIVDRPWLKIGDRINITNWRNKEEQCTIKEIISSSENKTEYKLDKKVNVKPGDVVTKPLWVVRKISYSRKPHISNGMMEQLTPEYIQFHDSDKALKEAIESWFKTKNK